MSNVVNLFAPERYCLNGKCLRVDCESHCWSCGGSHDHNLADFPFCKICELELETDEYLNLDGFWRPPEDSSLAPRRDKRVYLDQSLEDLLRDIGPQQLRRVLDDS